MSFNEALATMPKVVDWKETISTRNRYPTKGRRYFTREGRAWLRQWVPVIGFRGVGVLLGDGDHAVRSIVALWRASGEDWPPAPRKGYQFPHKKEVCALIGDKAKARIAQNGHPRGMAGKPQTERCKKAASVRMKNLSALGMHQFQRPVTDEQRKVLSARAANHLRAGGNVYSRCKHGRREDLGGQFFRSSWEANYARFLELQLQNHRILKWEYEPETFWFENIKRGTRSYTPDFRVTRLDGSRYYVEVKGWMDRKSKTKLARFRRYYKHETLELVDAKAYRRLDSALRGVIQGWEAA